MADTDPMAPTFDVTAGGETFTFRKPDIRYRIEIGYATARVRQRVDPSGAGTSLDWGLDRDAVDVSRYFAILEKYLERSTAPWAFQPGPDGKPVVDFAKIPLDKEPVVAAAATAFEEAVARFRAGGDPAVAPAGG